VKVLIVSTTATQPQTNRGHSLSNMLAIILYQLVRNRRLCFWVCHFFVLARLFTTFSKMTKRFD